MRPTLVSATLLLAVLCGISRGAEPPPTRQRQTTFQISESGMGSVSDLLISPSNAAYLAGFAGEGPFVSRVGADGTFSWIIHETNAPLLPGFHGSLAVDSSENVYRIYTDYTNLFEEVVIIKYSSTGVHLQETRPASPNPGSSIGAGGLMFDPGRGVLYAAMDFTDAPDPDANMNIKTAVLVVQYGMNLEEITRNVYRLASFGGGAFLKGGVYVAPTGQVHVAAAEQTYSPEGFVSEKAVLLRFDASLLSRIEDKRSGFLNETRSDPAGGMYGILIPAVLSFPGFPGASFSDYLPIAPSYGPLRPTTGGMLGVGPQSETYWGRGSRQVQKTGASGLDAWTTPVVTDSGKDAAALARVAGSALFLAGDYLASGRRQVYLDRYGAGAAFSMMISTGDGQRGTITKGLRLPLKVKLTNSLGEPAVGSTITFSTSSAPSGAAGHSLSTVSTTTAQDGTAEALLTLGDRVGTYAVNATCEGCEPSFVRFASVAELRLEISLSTDSIRPLGTETSPDQPRTTLLVTAAGVSFPLDRVENYPVILFSTPLAFTGGHNHGGNRPTGYFNLPGNPSSTQTTSGGLMEYVSSAFGGEELLTADSAIDSGVQTATRIVKVEVPGLAPMPASASPQKYFLSGGNTSHSANHFVSSATAAGLTSAAAQYFSSTQAAIGMNDMSLALGGMFDVKLKWTPPHGLHRVGRSVDVDRCAIKSNTSILVDQKSLDKIMLDQGGIRIVETPPVDNPVPACANKPINRMHYEFTR